MHMIYISIHTHTPTHTHILCIVAQLCIHNYAHNSIVYSFKNNHTHISANNAVIIHAPKLFSKFFEKKFFFFEINKNFKLKTHIQQQRPVRVRCTASKTPKHITHKQAHRSYVYAASPLLLRCRWKAYRIVSGGGERVVDRWSSVVQLLLLWLLLLLASSSLIVFT